MPCWTGLKAHCCAHGYSCKILCVDPRNHTCLFFLFLFRSHAIHRPMKMSQIIITQMITQSFSLYEYRTVLKGFAHSWWVLMERLYVLVCILICPFYWFDKLLKIKICTLSLCTTENCPFSLLFLRLWHKQLLQKKEEVIWWSLLGVHFASNGFSPLLSTLFTPVHR